MKKILILAFAISTALYACDVLEGPFDEQVIAPIDTTKPLRKIFLEDFTGHTCGNCPCAAEEAKKLDSIYEGRIIVVATHIGFFAEPYGSGSKFLYDFRTNTGNEVDNYFQIDGVGLPRGMVNRKASPTVILNPTAWATAIGQVDTAVIAELKMSKSYNAATRTATIQVNTKYLKAGNSNHQLVVYAVEDSIINWQKFYAQCSPTGANIDVPNFVHRHVLRGAINSTWGDALYTSGSTIPVGFTINKTFTKTLDPTWSEKHMSFVAFIQDNTTKEVIQVEEIHLY